MASGSIDIDDTQGDVSGVIKDSIASIGAKAFNNYGTLIINGATKSEEATLRKIQHPPAETDAIEKGTITREEFNALQQAIKEIKNLLERNQANSIKSRNIEISLDELSLNELILEGNEYSDKGNLITAIDYYDQAIKIDPNNFYVWFNKGAALGELRKYEEAIKCLDRAI